MKITTNYPLLGHNTFGIEAKAKCFVEYSTEDELVEYIRSHVDTQPLFHIGGGSNLLFTQDYDGTVLHSAIKGIELVKADTEKGEVLVRVGAGEVWDDFVAYAVSQGWYGVENLSLIPGEVGASVVQNIGAYGVEAQDVIACVETVDLSDGSKRIFDVSECEYGYRTSVFKTSLKGKYAVTRVVYRLSLTFHPQLEYGNLTARVEDVDTLTAQMLRDIIIDVRNAKLPDPKVQGNAGSFFMNPVVDRTVFENIRKDYPDMPYYEVADGVKIPAGWLIEQSGWKGRRLGRAGVHDKQALVLVNCGGATGRDILALCDAVRADVVRKFGVEIYPEVNVI